MNHRARIVHFRLLRGLKRVNVKVLWWGRNGILGCPRRCQSRQRPKAFMDSSDTNEGGWLSPEMSPFRADRISEYYCRIATTLLAPILGKQVEAICAICCPSFATEWAVQLVHFEKRLNPGYYLVSSNAASSIWEAGASVDVHRNEARISEEFSTAVYGAWRVMLERVRPMHRHGKDGVRYHFRCDFGALSGYAWSPDEGTQAGNLVSLSESLVQYTKAPDAARRKMATRIIAAATWFKTLQ